MQYLDNGTAGALHSTSACLHVALTGGLYAEPPEKAIRRSLHCRTSSASYIMSQRKVSLQPREANNCQ